MSSTAQLAANAANAQHSTGPRTPEGKERSPRNATWRGVDPLTVPDREKLMDHLARCKARIERSCYRALKEKRALQTKRMMSSTHEQQGKVRGQAPGLVTGGEVSKRTQNRIACGSR